MFYQTSTYHDPFKIKAGPTHFELIGQSCHSESKPDNGLRGLPGYRPWGSDDPLMWASHPTVMIILSHGSGVHWAQRGGSSSGTLMVGARTI